MKYWSAGFLYRICGYIWKQYLWVVTLPNSCPRRLRGNFLYLSFFYVLSSWIKQFNICTGPKSFCHCLLGSSFTLCPIGLQFSDIIRFLTSSVDVCDHFFSSSCCNISNYIFRIEFFSHFGGNRFYFHKVSWFPEIYW